MERLRRLLPKNIWDLVMFIVVKTLRDTRLRISSVFLTTFVVGGLAICHGAGGGVQSGPSRAETKSSEYICDTPGVKLEGRLSERTFYGPPGFGETPRKDAREKVLILNLAQPITVVPVTDAEAKGSASLDTLGNIRAVQLFLFPLSKRDQARKLIGKTVVVIGTLNEAVAPSEHLDVSMEVETLNPKQTP
jgi:hypothetical protein